MKFLEDIFFFFFLNWLTKERKGNAEKESKHCNSEEFARTTQIPALLHKPHLKTKQDWNGQSKAIANLSQYLACIAYSNRLLTNLFAFSLSRLIHSSHDFLSDLTYVRHSIISCLTEFIKHIFSARKKLPWWVDQLYQCCPVSEKTKLWQFKV